jgi:hypothetical protein
MTWKTTYASVDSNLIATLTIALGALRTPRPKQAMAYAMASLKYSKESFQSPNSLKALLKLNPKSITLSSPSHASSPSIFRLDWIIPLTLALGDPIYPESGLMLPSFTPPDHLFALPLKLLNIPNLICA